MRLILIFIMLAFVCIISTLHVSASAHGPEKINLQTRFDIDGFMAPVIFPHAKHQARLECVKCHISPDGGGKLKVDFVNKNGTGNDFHKKFCWPCHKKMDIPKGTSCSTCHKKRGNCSAAPHLRPIRPPHIGIL